MCLNLYVTQGLVLHICTMHDCTTVKEDDKKGDGNMITTMLPELQSSLTINEQGTFVIT